MTTDYTVWSPRELIEEIERYRGKYEELLQGLRDAHVCVYCYKKEATHGDICKVCSDNIPF